MGSLFSKHEALKIKYIPGYELEKYGAIYSHSTTPKATHKWGITINVVNDFLQEAGGREKLQGLTTREVCNQILKPLMNAYKPGNGSSYAYYNRRQKLHRGVRDAEIYVVHAWDSIFLDVVDAMREYTENCETVKDSPPVPLWFDMLCVNQCKPIKARQYSIDFFQKSFVTGIENTMHMMVVMTPWDKPLVFNRTWCLWEIFVCLSSIRDIKLGFALTKEQYVEFKKSLAEDSPMTIPYSYFRLVDQIQVKTSQTTSKRHNATIAYMAEQVKGGKHRVNQQLRECFKTWVIREGEQTIVNSDEGTEESTDAQVALANIYRYLGRAKVCIPLLEAALETRQRTLGNLHDKTITAAYMLGNMYRYDRKYESSLGQYLYCLKQNRKLHGDVHPITINMVLAVGLIYASLRRTDDITALYTEFLAIYTVECGEDHEYTVMMRNNIAHFFMTQNKVMKGKEKDLTKLEVAVSYMDTYMHKRMAALDIDHPDVLYLMNDYANCNAQLNRCVTSTTIYQKIYILTRLKYTNLGNDEHPFVLDAKHNLACSLIAKDMMLKDTENNHEEECVSLLTECLQSRKKVLGYLHSDTIKTRDALIHFWHAKNDFASPTKHFEESKDDRSKFKKREDLNYLLPHLITREQHAARNEEKQAVTEHVKYRVVLLQGAYIRDVPSYDTKVKMVAILDEREVVETTSDMPTKRIRAPNGKRITWIQLTTHNNGWIPMMNIDGEEVIQKIHTGVMAYEVVLEAGAYVRDRPSYDKTAVVMVDTIDEGDIVHTDSRMPIAEVTAPNGKKIIWIQLHTKQDGWVPMHNINGDKVLQVI